MVKKKDNLTDVVEQLPQSASTSSSTPPKDQVVIANDGTVVTLGKKPDKNRQITIQGKSFELSVVENMIQEAVKEQIKELPRMILEELEKKLKKEGLI